jgi:methylenetetrahydrofolate--tRNA-(uracil-5-)-methyltransferase
MSKKLIIIGAGLAGSEAAWQAAKFGMQVELYEMRSGTNLTHAHKTDYFAELVCSNSFRNDDVTSAIGLLHEELRRLDSLIMKIADKHRLPAGSALAVDRDEFAKEVQAKVESHPNIKVFREEVKTIPQDVPVIIATGPLTSDELTQKIIELTGESQLAFFDAIAPIIAKDTIDFSKCWMQSRYDKAGPGGNGQDYINCPLSKEEYYNFVNELIQGDKTEYKEWEKNTPYFNGCLPIEVMAERGVDTLRFGPMKPVGLTNPHSSDRPYAVVQLRQDNKLGTLYNMVGFQTKLKYGEQKRVFSKIPGLENADFVRLGGLHRNTFIKSPILLDEKLRLKKNKNIYFAGQITGVEGYVESASMGLLAGIFAAFNMHGKDINISNKTAIGSLLAHLTQNANSDNFQPMNVNFGLFPDLDIKFKKHEKNQLYVDRAFLELEQFIDELKNVAFN